MYVVGTVRGNVQCTVHDACPHGCSHVQDAAESRHLARMSHENVGRLENIESSHRQLFNAFHEYWDIPSLPPDSTTVVNVHGNEKQNALCALSYEFTKLRTT